MATVTITLTDTPAGSVAVHSTFTPAVGKPCTPAQGVALEITRLVRREWPLDTTQVQPGEDTQERA